MRKWTPSKAIQSVNALHSRDVVGRSWSLGPAEVACEEVRGLEAERHATVIEMAKHGQWTTWESEEKRNTTPQNLKKWFREDPTCSLCQKPASLRHILTECTF